jgi:competence protein ComEC
MQTKKIFFLLLFFVFLLIFVGAYFYNQIEEQLEISFIDVGQGDASLVQTPFGQNILIDGGPDEKVLFELSELLAPWDRTIDLLILTHPHDDHVSGLMSVLQKYRVKNVIHTGVYSDNPVYQEYQAIIKSQNIALINNKINFIKLGDNCNLLFLYPQADISGQVLSNLNNTSIVVQLDCLDKKVLFMGDAELEVENFLLANDFELDSDIIKIGHHGSDTSSSLNFLEEVNPQIAVISLGDDNKFGHPSQRVINRLQRLNLDIYQTNIVGTINFIIKNDNFYIN